MAGGTGELRRSYHDQLRDIDANVRQLFALVTNVVAAATDTFLAADREKAEEIAARDGVIDRLKLEVEEMVEPLLILQSPVASELRYLVSILRLVPELERSADLAEHIAGYSASGLGQRLSPRVRGLIQDMGDEAVAMWKVASLAFDGEGTADAAERLEQADDVLDALHDHLRQLLDESDLALGDGIAMGLVARFYERLGDHALHVAERIRTLNLR